MLIKASRIPPATTSAGSFPPAPAPVDYSTARCAPITVDPFRYLVDVVNIMSSADGAVMGAAPPPPGVAPNFEHPDWIGYRLIIVAVVFPVLSLCFLIPRLYSAAFIIRKWHPDDCKMRR